MRILPVDPPMPLSFELCGTKLMDKGVVFLNYYLETHLPQAPSLPMLQEKFTDVVDPKVSNAKMSCTEQCRT